ncbi:UNVERIFIED_CONTAM: Gld [Trichonephila clavipes]
MKKEQDSRQIRSATVLREQLKLQNNIKCVSSHNKFARMHPERLKKCKEIGESEPLRKIGSKRFSTVYPGCEKFLNDDDEYFRCMARSILLTCGHPIGTVKMGNPRDPSTVLDPQLRVKTIRNLRVVDASVMPNITSGNTNIPTMMIAEKASDMIKASIRCEHDNDLRAIGNL